MPQHPRHSFRDYLQANQTFLSLGSSWNKTQSTHTWPSLTTLTLKYVICLDTQYYYSTSIKHFNMYTICIERLCGLVVRVPGYRSGGAGLDSLRYQIFWVVVGLERGLLSLMSTTEKLLGRNSSGSGLENQEYGHRDSSRWPRDTIYPQKLALTSPTGSRCSVGSSLAN
jgi:hypothetical protein